MVSSSEWRSAAALRLLRAAGDAKTVREAVAIVTEKLLEGVACPPTDLKLIATKLNVIRVSTEDVPFSGQLQRDNGGFRIVLSKHLSPVRKRFTIAHELGHAFFETTGPNCPRTGQELERICDLIAANLLLPRQQFVAAAGSFRDVSVGQIRRASDLFQASLSATSFRFSELFGATIFEVQEEEITWATGAVKKGPLLRAKRELQEAVRAAFIGAVQEPFSIAGHIWTLDWSPLGNRRRGLFVLVPNRSHQRERRVFDADVMEMLNEPKR